MKKIISAITCAAVLAATVVAAPNTAMAAQKVPVGFVQNGAGFNWAFSDGTVLKNDWLELNGLKWHFDANGNMQTGLVTVGKKTYFLNVNGIVGTGWQQIGDGIYYFNADGSMAKNTTVDGFKLGKDGKVVFTAEQLAMAAAAAQAASGAATQANVTTAVSAEPVTNQALAQTVQSILAGIITPDMTDDQKLLACFEYVLNSMSYKRTYETPGGDFTGQYALEAFTTHQGNCYRYASAFAYLAKGAGFDAHVVTGMISAARGGLTPHGWAEVNVGGVWYLFDPDMADAKDKFRNNMFKVTYETYPVKPLNPQATYMVHF